MSKENQHLDDIREIRSIMERSSQFLSLSGLSGIFAGIIALLGATFVYFYLQNYESHLLIQGNTSVWESFFNGDERTSILWTIVITALVVLTLAISFAVLFSARKASRMGMPVWNSSARRLIINLFIPVAAGGIFSTLLLYHNLIILIAPSMLIFYGLGLINASKYTLRDIRYLGFSEMVLGLAATYWVGYGFLFWTIGFGFLHLVYGFIMFWKYDRMSTVISEQKNQGSKIYSK